MAKETLWFGRGSRIIITTQDRRLLRAHRIKDIYEVNFPKTDEALQIFCLYAFGEKSPEEGFEELALEVTQISGNLPLGLRVMGSYFRGMSKHEWAEALPRLRTHLDSDIQSNLNYCYNVLDYKDKDLFLHISCFFRGYPIDQTLEETLGKNFSNMRHGLRVLAEKSLISIDGEYIKMHNLLAQLGVEIVRKQSIYEPGQRQFLVDARDICEVLTEDTGSRSVLGIKLELSEVEKELYISERAFQGMPNLQFLSIRAAFRDEYTRKKLHFRRGLDYLPRKLRILHWEDFQITSFPSEFHTEFLVELYMPGSMLEKLWEGIHPLRNLRWLNLEYSENLKELPDLSTATNLQKLDLYYCSSLELPSSIGNASNLKHLISEEVPSSIKSWSRLQDLEMPYSENLKRFPHALDSITMLDLRNSEVQEIGPWIKSFSRLFRLTLEGCRKLVSLPQLPESLLFLNAGNCESLERLDCSFHNPNIYLNFGNCFKLNQEARDLIIQTPTNKYTVLPCGEVPAYFSDQANGVSVTVKLNERPLHTFLRFKACILLVDKGSKQFDCKTSTGKSHIEIKQNGSVVTCIISEVVLRPLLAEHLYTFEIYAEVTSNKLVFEFNFDSDRWEIRECGLLQLLEVPRDEDCEKNCNKKLESMQHWIMFGLVCL